MTRQELEESLLVRGILPEAVEMIGTMVFSPMVARDGKVNLISLTTLLKSMPEEEWPKVALAHFDLLNFQIVVETQTSHSSFVPILTLSFDTQSKLVKYIFTPCFLNWAGLRNPSATGVQSQ